MRTQPNDGDSDHIGYVEKVENGQIVTIEGNMHECVDRRYIEIAWGYIRGFAQPKFCSKGYQVAVDGYFGRESVRALQRCINDGNFGN